MIERVSALRGSYIPDGVQISVTRNYGVTANDKAMKFIEKLRSPPPPSCCWFY